VRRFIPGWYYLLIDGVNVPPEDLAAVPLSSIGPERLGHLLDKAMTDPSATKDAPKGDPECSEEISFGMVLGVIHFHTFGCADLPNDDSHSHVLWTNEDGELRMSVVRREPASDVDPAAWAQLYEKVRRLRLILYGV
jgi:hypothetical protein